MPSTQENPAPPLLIHGVILASGLSRRFGSGQQKLLLPFRGLPLISHVAQAACASRVEAVTIVTGFRGDEVEGAVRQSPGTRKARFVRNPHYSTGRSSTVQRGLGALPEDATHVIFLLGDQPLMTTALIDRLVEATHEHREAKVLYPLCVKPGGDQPVKGNPTVFSRELFPELESIPGDQSGLQLIQKLGGEVFEFHWHDDQTQLNINTMKDYQTLLKLDSLPKEEPGKP